LIFFSTFRYQNDLLENSVFKPLGFLNHIQHITGKWPLTIMHALMFLETTLLTEGFITYITGKWPLPTMNALMRLQMTMLPE
jgi:hypothetical protein